MSGSPENRTTPGMAVALLVLATGCEVRDEQATQPTLQWLAAAHVDGPPGVDNRRAAAALRIEYVEGYEAGLRRAADGGLPMLVVFRAAWCRWSGELAQGALTERQTVDLSRRFVCVIVDADRDEATCRRFGIGGFPTVVLIDASGEERFRATGSAAAGGLTAAMRDLLGTADDPQRMASRKGDAAR